MENKLEKRHTDAAAELIDIVIDSLEGRETSLQILAILGALAGRLALHHIIDKPSGTDQTTQAITLPASTDRCFQLYTFISNTLKLNGLERACINGPDLPVIPDDFINKILNKISTAVENTFNKYLILTEERDLVAAYAIVSAIDIIKNKIREDITGSLAYASQAMFTAYKTNSELGFQEN